MQYAGSESCSVLRVSSAGPLGRAEVSTAPCSSSSTRQSLGTVPRVKRPQGQAQNWEFYFLGKSRILRHVVSKSEMGVGMKYSSLPLLLLPQAEKQGKAERRRLQLCNEYSFRPASCFFWTAVRPLGAVSLLAEGSGGQCGSAIIGLCFGCRMHVDHLCSPLACPRVDHIRISLLRMLLFRLW